jgi:hypothetical protein
VIHAPARNNRAGAILAMLTVNEDGPGRVSNKNINCFT